MKNISLMLIALCIFSAVKAQEERGTSQRSKINVLAADEAIPLTEYEGLTLVHVGDKFGFKDKNGKIVIPIEYDSVDFFKNGRTIVSIKNKFGIIDKNGNIIVPLIYDRVSPYKMGCL